jgi:hypothetical protein
MNKKERRRNEVNKMTIKMGVKKCLTRQENISIVEPFNNETSNIRMSRADILA